jgi:hypothetical protein
MSGVNAQTRTEQALDLLRLAVSCPVKPLVEEQLEPVSASGTYRTFVTSRFTGDSGTFRVIVRVERRLHDRRGNTVMEGDGTTAYSSSFSTIAAADIVGSDAAQNPVLGVACRNDKCITRSENEKSAGSANETDVDSVEIPFCDVSMASKAKLAIELLSAAVQPSAPAVRPFELHPHVMSSGPNLGDEQPGVSASECLRLCRANSRCAAFTIVHGAEYTVCELKRASGTLSADKFADTGVMDVGGASPFNDKRQPQSGVWKHNGSDMTLVVRGTHYQFIYHTPKSDLLPLGVKQGTLMFDGTREGGKMVGKAYVFSRSCGQLEYEVTGRAYNRQITLDGPTPQIKDSATCQVSYRKVRPLLFDRAD